VISLEIRISGLTVRCSIAGRCLVRAMCFVDFPQHLQIFVARHCRAWSLIVNLRADGGGAALVGGWFNEKIQASRPASDRIKRLNGRQSIGKTDLILHKERSLMKKLYMIATLLGLLTLASGRADAGSLTLNFSGEFGPTTTLDGTALGSDTPFTFAATFDSTAGIFFATGAYIFPTVVTFDISGHGIYTSVPGSDVYVGLEDPSSGSRGYAAVLTNKAVTQDFGAAFTTTSPTITAADPMPTTFSGLINASGFFHLTVPLQGGAGDLVVNDLVTNVGSASITAAAVPEPGTLTLSGFGLAIAGIGAWRRRRNRHV
jgi:PEP-CTERM motif